ncbi:MAG: TolC family protein [Myxococcales bacterium]|nr:TolC family protein [Myxococcales bacterium]
MRALIALLCFAIFTSWAHAAPKTVYIATIADGPWAGNGQMRGLIRNEITELTRGEFLVEFPADLQLDGDWTAAGITAKLDTAYKDPRTTMVITFGLLGSHFAARREVLEKPTIAGLVFDPDMQAIPSDGNKSGKQNLTYIVQGFNMKRDLQVLAQVAPFSRVAILGNPYFLEGLPHLTMEATRQLRALDADSIIFPLGNDPEATVAALPRDVDAVYVTPLWQLDEQGFDKLVKALIARRLPSFSMLGRPGVERGLLVGTHPEADIERYTRRIGLMAQMILIGEPAANLPVDYESREELTLNIATAQAIGADPSWEVLTEAELVGAEDLEIERKYSLADAAAAAVKANRKLISTNAGIDAAEHDIDKARASLLPTVEASASGIIIDSDRAAASFGQQPERSVKVTGKVTQLIYNDGAWANLEIQETLHDSRHFQRESTELDIVHQTTVAYLNVLRARTGERIRRDNLKLTRSNLELARIRARVGSGRIVDTHRWEAQIANDQTAVIDSHTQVELAMQAFNQLLGEPLESPFELSEVEMDDPHLMTSREVVVTRIVSPKGFAKFRDFMSQEALRASPELRQLDALIAATDRRALAARRALWAPTVALSGEINQRVYGGGKGTSGLSVGVNPSDFALLGDHATPIGNIFTSLGNSFVTTDDTEWYVGLSVSLPLYQGGARYAEIHQADAELVSLRAQRRELAEGIEQRVRYAVHQASSAFPRIQLSQQSAEAAHKGLDAARDAYGRGVLDLVTLLDSQNNAKVSDELTANAVYDFLVAMMDVHRAVGVFFFQVSDADKAAFDQRFIQYMDGPNPQTGDDGAAEGNP